MSKEFKFRGLNRNSKKWYYGSLLITRQLGIHHAQIWLLDEDYPVPVDIETVGQYLFIRDKHSKEIYDGDIVKWQDGPGEEGANFEVEWPGRVHGDEIYGENWKVIGNIYENPELLEKVKPDVNR